MKAINDYKNTIWEVAHLLFVFSFADSNDKLSKEALNKWQIEDIKKVADAVSHFHPAIDIKTELTADMPTKEALCLKLDYTFLELETDMPFGFKNWLPIFDEAYYKSDKFYNALVAINGKEWALLALMHIENIIVHANLKIKALVDILKKLCQFAGYNGDALAQRIFGDNGYKSLADEANKTKRKDTNVSRKETSTLPFRCLIQNADPDEVISWLHSLIDEREGADVGAPLLALINKHYLTRKPTEKEFKTEFSINRSWKAVAQYMNPDYGNALARANDIVVNFD